MALAEEAAYATAADAAESEAAEAAVHVAAGRSLLQIKLTLQCANLWPIWQLTQKTSLQEQEIYLIQWHESPKGKNAALSYSDNEAENLNAPGAASSASSISWSQAMRDYLLQQRYYAKAQRRYAILQEQGLMHPYSLDIFPTLDYSAYCRMSCGPALLRFYCERSLLSKRAEAELYGGMSCQPQAIATAVSSWHYHKFWLKSQNYQQNLKRKHEQASPVAPASARAQGPNSTISTNTVSQANQADAHPEDSKAILDGELANLNFTKPLLPYSYPQLTDWRQAAQAYLKPWSSPQNALSAATPNVANPNAAKPSETKLSVATSRTTKPSAAKLSKTNLSATSHSRTPLRSSPVGSSPLSSTQLKSSPQSSTHLGSTPLRPALHQNRDKGREKSREEIPSTRGEIKPTPSEVHQYVVSTIAACEPELLSWFDYERVLHEEILTNQRDPRSECSLVDALREHWYQHYYLKKQQQHYAEIYRTLETICSDFRQELQLPPLSLLELSKKQHSQETNQDLANLSNSNQDLANLCNSNQDLANPSNLNQDLVNQANHNAAKPNHTSNREGGATSRHENSHHRNSNHGNSNRERGGARGKSKDRGRSQECGKSKDGGRSQECDKSKDRGRSQECGKSKDGGKSKGGGNSAHNARASLNKLAPTLARLF